ncbi:MAG: hypothetical protein QG608_1452 [Actinomycetota bacterium]|nr:hypothetical protein [Actinomycetota bacterium]
MTTGTSSGGGLLGEWIEWAGWTCDGLDEVAQMGSCTAQAGESVEQAAASIGITGLVTRSAAAADAVRQALSSTSATRSAWQDALAAVRAVDGTAPAGAGAAGATDGVGTAPDSPGAEGSPGAAVPGPDGSPAARGSPEPSAVPAPGAAPVAVPTAPQSRSDRLRSRIPGLRVRTQGDLETLGFSHQQWEDTHEGAVLSLSPTGRHVRGSNPVDDPLWVTAVDNDGKIVEQGPLLSTCDRLALAEHTEDPPWVRTRARNLARHGGALGLATGVNVATTGMPPAAAAGVGMGVEAAAAGAARFSRKPADRARRKTARDRKAAADPTTPRLFRFSRPLRDLEGMEVRVDTCDIPLRQREQARTATKTLLRIRAKELGLPRQEIAQALSQLNKIPQFPRQEGHRSQQKHCRQAAMMHVAHGRQQLVEEILRSARREDGR